MKVKNQSCHDANVAKAIGEVIERTTRSLENRHLNVLQNPASGQTRITVLGPDCEDGMVQLRWRVP